MVTFLLRDEKAGSPKPGVPQISAIFRGRVGQRDRTREGGRVKRRSRRELALVAAGPGASQRAGHRDEERATRSRDPCRPARLWFAVVRGGGAYVEAHSAARQPLVHSRSRRENTLDSLITVSPFGGAGGIT